MQRVACNGTELAYRVDGEPGAPWLLIANSLAADHRMWHPQVEGLTAGHRVLRFDTRGHGESPATQGPYSLELLVADVAGLMDALGIERANYLGLSLGGMVGLGLALTHPKKISRMVCCAARADAPPEFASVWAERIQLVQEQGLSAVVDETLQRWFTAPFLTSADNAATAELVRDMILTTSVAGYCGCAAALPGLSYGSRLSEIDVPVLYVAGSDDVGAPAEVMQEMAAATPKAVLEVIEPAAHLFNLEQPERFSRIVTSFLASPG